ncbi:MULTISPECIES: sensor histidine kinase [Paenibacillus]|uniref:sensor histidine kinase n=1 Tax=Paenibacillus TaxID=44249 RepID=UPI000891DB3D|nr:MULTISPECIES: ATP-binding protein [Paenibacillus]WDQ34155.1 ATP-binding protein [Paenibacillus marchantiae]SDL69655.1 two-component system, chemotaxis family, sensor kinase CheA [Paenibacillus sp. OK060]SLK08171.1 two-component system, chemotaxis family, sensor kinase CheA [Paenibacillus sp. RU5A]SOC70939.1 two-component system, chemotaxis family, sensor kinase CheA [Paenibacillus sp. RU26A]SOC73403.1 two-component system, chemotaxis family, sensor kinase CheA [Paenibacillus sp. RU5M]
MQFSKMFVLNMGMLITIAYLASVFYKYVVIRASSRVKQICSLFVLIFAGWISTVFGFQLNDEVVFDLRFVPLIVAVLTYRQPYSVIIVGVGIGLTRLTFGINDATVAALINMSILGVLCAGLNIWMRRSDYRLIVKGVIVILIVNVVNSVNIAIVGVIPATYFFSHIMPYTLPVGILLSLIFAFILRDFQNEQNRILLIQSTNRLLSVQKEELQKAQIVLEDRAKQLMITSQYKSEFLANMSHELRTPLNSVINFAQMISENGDTLEQEDVVRFATMIEHSGQELLTLINDILDLSKVEAGRLDIVLEDISVAQLTEDAMNHFQLVAEKKGVQLQLDKKPGLPETLWSDPQRVQQILRNLMSNAIKFTHQGKVTLTVSTKQMKKSGVLSQWIVFSVQDTGIGIAEDKHQSIFEAFQQADGSISRKFGGTGLGLSISRDLARLLDGSIELKSAEGKGSTFYLYLPLNREKMS